MGCTGANKNYFEPESEEERKLRVFERDSLKLIGTRFFSDIQKAFQAKILGVETVTKELVSTFFKNEGLESLGELVATDYFWKNNTINSVKVDLLFFLLSQSKPSAPVKGRSKSTFDKATFIYLLVKCHNDDLELPITKEDDRLISMVDLMIELSTVVIVDFYGSKANSSSEELNNLRKKKEATRNHVIDHLFGQNKHEAISLKDINECFEVDPYFLSSGRIREEAANSETTAENN